MVLLLGSTIVMLLSWSATITHAQLGTGVVRVAPFGYDNKDCGGEDSPCRTIAWALSHTNSGDTILLAQGVYTLSPGQPLCRDYGMTPAVVCVRRRTMTIIGGYSGTDWTTPDWELYPTILDGENANRVILVQNAALRLEDVTVQNGLAEGVLYGSIMETSAYGAGLQGTNATLTLRHVIFKNNEARGGGIDMPSGGRAVGAGLSMNNYDSAPTVNTLEHVVFENNVARGGVGQARGGFGIGGGLHLYNVIVTGSYLTFTNNLAVSGPTNGPGYLSNDPPGLHTYADAQGGAAAIYFNALASFDHVTAIGNRAIGGDAPNGDAGGSFGGAFYFEHGQGQIVDADVRNNLAQGGTGHNPTNGAGMAEGGAIQSDDSNITLIRAYVINNIARGGAGDIYKGPVGGGGLALTRLEPGNDGSVLVDESIVADNRAELPVTGTLSGGGGGGMFLQGVTAQILHTTIASNTVSDELYAPGVIVIGPFTPGLPPTVANFDYTIFAGHAGGINSPYVGRALHVQPGSTANLHQGLWSDNQLPDVNFDSPIHGNIHGLETMITGTANFVSPGAPDFDYHIFGDSAARDHAIDSSELTDIDGESRTIFPPPDIGADEYVPIVLSAAPSGAGRLLLIWRPNAWLAANTSHYSIVVTPEPGANPPPLGSPIDAGTATSFVLDGLSDTKTYTLSVQALTDTDLVIETSNTVVAMPLPYAVFLPLLSQ